MTRKQFIESQGATCLNWNWSWSFVTGAAFSWTSTIAELSVPWSSLANPSVLDLFFYGDNVSVGGNTIDWYPDAAPQPGGAFFRYRR